MRSFTNTHIHFARQAQRFFLAIALAIQYQKTITFDVKLFYDFKALTNQINRVKHDASEKFNSKKHYCIVHAVKKLLLINQQFRLLFFADPSDEYTYEFE